MRCGRNGNSLPVPCSRTAAKALPRAAAMVARSSARDRSCGLAVRTASAIAVTASSLSATAPISTGKLRPISAGSMSIWISRDGGKRQV